jgi:large subunit ribosomal protein L5e
MRYQVKFERRRKGITDYQQRRALVVQDKNKYNARKYRLVVRITNTKVICQIVYSTIKGDFVMEVANSAELKGYGIGAGLTNYAACYATGLLVARRILTKLKLADAFTGTDEVTGEYFLQEGGEGGEEDPRAFKAYLDLGLARPSTGARVFGAMKGAVDGGVAIPHSEHRFPGTDEETKELDAEVLRNYIFANHVSEYMEFLKEEDPELFKQQFSVYLKNGLTADNLEEKWEACHAAIRAEPLKTRLSGEKKKYNIVIKGKRGKMSRQQKVDRVKQKLTAWKKKMAADAE